MISAITNFTIALLCLLNTSVGFDIKQLIQKRMQKEITKVFQCKDFDLLEITASPGFQIKNGTFLTDHQIFEIKKGGDLLGYAFLGTAPSKTDTFDYLILFDQSFIQKKAKIMVYREDYGGEISSSRWLSQFSDTDLNSKFVYGDNISAISGATISVKSMTNSINYVYSQLQHQLAVVIR